MKLLIAFLALWMANTGVNCSEHSSSLDGSLAAHSDNGSQAIEFYSVPAKAVTSLSYIVGLRNSANSRSYCAGVLVAPRWVLTTVACAPIKRGFLGISWAYKDQFATIGSTEVSGAGGEKCRVIDSSHHPDYNKKTRENNYMLLKLDQESKNDPVAIVPDGSHVFESDISASVYGWDWSSDSSVATWPGLLNNTMHWASDCRNTVDKVYASQFCAIGNKTTDACHINEGSPVISNIMGQDMLAGFVNYNPGCGKSDTPTLFSRASKGQRWIMKTIGS